MEGKITVNGIEYAEPMPGKPLLSEIDIHNIINYISKNINTNLKPVQIQDVNNQVLNCSTK
jgi:mono/diheme cytochrome c family protein